ncbi:Cytochrome P450 3A25 [Halotydeus destructor]|nr:Cytochrome P450 3A25 [Halotydeus destructor]
MDSLLLAAIFVLATIRIYLHFKRKYAFWKDKGMATPRYRPLVGNALDCILEPMQDVMFKNAKACGDTYGIYVGTNPSLVTSDTELIKHITVKDAHVFVNRLTIGPAFGELGRLFLFNLEDEQWRRIRLIMTPTFTSVKMKHMFDVMRDCSEDSVASLEKFEGKSLDLREYFGFYTLDVIARCCFASDLDFYNNQQSNLFIKNASRLMKPNALKFASYFLLPETLFNMIKPEVFSQDAISYFKSIIERMIREHQSADSQSRNLLDILMDARADDGDDRSKSNTLTDDEILAQAIVFIAAGYDATSTLLAFTFYLLALNTDIQEKLHSELSQDMCSDYDKLVNHPYLEAVIHETLRLYPPAVVLSRQASEDYKLPGTDVTIPRGMDVQISTWRVHRDPSNYPEPDKFDPSRFLPENRNKIKPYSYLPFGSGIRNCIGMRFALLEAKVIIADMLMKYKFVKIKSTPAKPKFNCGLGLLSYDPIHVGIELRTHKFE